MMIKIYLINTIKICLILIINIFLFLACDSKCATCETNSFNCLTCAVGNRNNNPPSCS